MHYLGLILINKNAKIVNKGELVKLIITSSQIQLNRWGQYQAWQVLHHRLWHSQPCWTPLILAEAGHRVGRMVAKEGKT